MTQDCSPVNPTHSATALTNHTDPNAVGVRGPKSGPDLGPQVTTRYFCPRKSLGDVQITAMPPEASLLWGSPGLGLSSWVAPSGPGPAGQQRVGVGSPGWRPEGFKG